MWSFFSRQDYHDDDQSGRSDQDPSHDTEGNRIRTVANAAAISAA
jgi:hypothetical protein